MWKSNNKKEILNTSYADLNHALLKKIFKLRLSDSSKGTQQVSDKLTTRLLCSHMLIFPSSGTQIRPSFRIKGKVYLLSYQEDIQNDCPLVEAVIFYRDGTPDVLPGEFFQESISKHFSN